MAVQWVKVGIDVGVGGAAGVVDQLIQNQDDKRIAEKPDLGMMAQIGTYYNYGVPILAILGTAFGFLKGDWATRGIVVGSQLAGRKATKRLTGGAAVPFTNWSRNRQMELARVKALANPKKQIAGDFTPPGIPVIENEAILV